MDTKFFIPRNKKLQHEFVLAADINEYLQLVSELGKNKTVILALTGNYGALGDVYLNGFYN